MGDTKVKNNLWLITIFILFMVPRVLMSIENGGNEDSLTETKNESQIISELSRAIDTAPNTPKYQPLEVKNHHYCPAEGRQREILAQYIADFPTILKTLFLKQFHHQEQLCLYEIEPVLVARLDENGKIKTFGKTTHQIYLFAFQLWKELLPPSLQLVNKKPKGPLPSINTKLLVIYEIGYDTRIERVTWTKQIPEKNSKPELNKITNQFASTTNELSKEPSCFAESYLSTIDEAFNYNNANSNNPKMIRQQLVPEQDVLPFETKATNHLINIAPLWYELASLMEVINYGILLADYQISKNHPDETDKHRLTIYTKLFYPTLGFTEWLQKNSPHNLRVPKIWCKFVHYEAEKSGILIYVHNTPDKPPKQKDQQCNKEDLFECDFTNWIDKEDVFIKNQEYAYCCNATGSEIVKYFQVEQQVERILDLDKIILEAQKSEDQ